MTLFVAQQPRGPGIDLTVLEDYAKAQNEDIRFVFTKGFNVSQHLQEATATAESFAAGFDFRHDRLVLAGGDPLAGLVLAIALTHEAIAVDAQSFGSLRFIRERDPTGQRTIPLYVPIDIPTGI